MPPEPSALSDDELIREFDHTSGEAGDPEVEALIEEIERRELDL